MSSLDEKSIEEFNKKFPYKVELHVHLDGAVRPETILEIAAEKGVLDNLPHKTVEQFTKDVVHKVPSSLEEVLLSFTYFMPIITGSSSALTRVAYEFCEDSAKHSIKYTEVRYCPHLFSNSVDNPENAKVKGEFTPRDAVVAINEGLARGMKDFGIKVYTILCCMTHRPDWSKEVLELCKEFKNDGIVGIDLAGQEFHPGADPDDCEHKKAFAEAKLCGINRTVHAGEIGTYAAVNDALDHMMADRIGHGYHAIDDEATYSRVIKDQIHLETCPISSIITKSCDPDIQKHPLRTFVRDGVNYSVNTDDPMVLGNNMTDDYRTVKEMGLSDNDIIKGIFNAARSCFAPEEEKRQILNDLNKIYGEH